MSFVWRTAPKVHRQTVASHTEVCSAYCTVKVEEGYTILYIPLPYSQSSNICKMNNYKASSYPYTILRQTKNQDEVYPYLRSLNGDKEMWCISPHHGRSYIIGRNKEGKYIVSKGNGLSYSQHNFLNTGELGDDTFGLLLLQDAIRDFNVGLEVEQLGVKTNHMEYVIQLEHEIALSNGHILKPILLQYSVECPFRICDASFPEYSSIIKDEINKWEKYNVSGVDKSHLVAANVLLHNLKVLHTHNILHNAINAQNYTWALELLDFEIACSPTYPYEKEDDDRHIKDYFSREIVYTYEIINYIAHYLNEPISYQEIDDLFKSYGFDLSSLK